MKNHTKRPWNKDRIVGARVGLSKAHLAKIRLYLEGKNSPHDLCLFLVAIDSMLRASDLLRVKVGDLVKSNGWISPSFLLKQTKTGKAVKATLTPTTRKMIFNWVTYAGTTSENFLFTRDKPKDAAPISRGHYRTLIKDWCDAVGIESADISSHSLRRTKPIYLYEKGVSIEIIARLLGHRSTASTLHYLGIDDAKAKAIALKYDVFK